MKSAILMRFALTLRTLLRRIVLWNLLEKNLCADPQKVDGWNLLWNFGSKSYHFKEAFILTAKRTMQGLMGALMALMLLSGCGLQADDASHSVEAKAEQTADMEGVEGTAPAFKATAFDGSDVAINAAMDKKLYVINFWATWCPPCRAEMPELNEFAKKHDGEVTFYAINLQEPKETVDKFLKDNGYTMPVLLDLNGEAADIYRVRAIPTTYVIDRDGTILLKKIGGTTAAELETALLRAAK